MNNSLANNNLITTKCYAYIYYFAGLIKYWKKGKKPLN